MQPCPAAMPVLQKVVLAKRVDAGDDRSPCVGCRRALAIVSFPGPRHRVTKLNFARDRLRIGALLAVHGALNNLVQRTVHPGTARRGEGPGCGRRMPIR